MTTLSSLVKGRRSRSGKLKAIDFLEEIDDAFHEDFIERLSCVDKYFTKSPNDVGPLIPEIDEAQLNSMQKKHKRDCEQIRDSDILWQAKKDYKRLFGNKYALRGRPEPSLDAVVAMLSLGLIAETPERPEEIMLDHDSTSKTGSPSRRKSGGSSSSSVKTDLTSLVDSIDSSQ